MKIATLILSTLLTFPSEVVAFSSPSALVVNNAVKSASLFPSAAKQNREQTKMWASAAIPLQDGESSEKRGLFEFKTKAGWINPFSLYYGFVALFLGLPWFIGLTIAQILYTITRDKFDQKRRIPIFLSHCWGVALLFLTRSIPDIEGHDILKKFYKENRAAMFVANHNSWMDIPFMGYTMGWRNYKLISKAELGKVPILGKSIKEGGHVMVDRSNRKSQLQTFKAGVQWLLDGVHLCAFPEGTRSKNGRLLPFKAGAYKMAIKAGSPIVPLSIVGSGKAHPSNYIFPRFPSKGICKVIIHKPIETVGRTEEELSQLVRSAVMSGLPEDQLPLEH
jgi:1-acyl-sn-glycerol-3-phosphate acyltransferase